ncbi:MAG: hypothetical protein V2A73_16285 [Pseudomonadota bacterium]
MIDLFLREFLDRYANLSLEEMKARMREDGFGALSDLADESIQELMRQDPELLKQMILSSPFGAAIGDSIDDVDDTDGVMPPAPETDTIPVGLDDDIFFDQEACLTSCTGRCCERKNYLMIGLPDIYRIVSSPAARHLGICSTADLFGRQPSLLQSFYNEEYGLYLPYIRYKPVGATEDVLPEDAPGSVCPFLFPIDEVVAFHGGKMPDKASREARGCILMRDKPKVCRLSPLGAFAGLTTGRTSYVYCPPASDCPACNTKVVVKLADYLREIELPGEAAQEEQVHRIAMATHRRPLTRAEKRQFGDILQQLYNIDELLLRLGVDLQHRPSVVRLVSVGMKAAEGSFEPYEELVQEITELGGKG